MTGMGLINRVQVYPLHRQVAIIDHDAADAPRWETGEEPLVASEQTILVATRADLDPVELEVWVGTPTTPPPGPLIFDGELLTTGKGVEVGGLVVGEVLRVELSIGSHPLRIYADQPGNAGRLRIVFDPAPDRSPQPAPPANPRPSA
jgi:hypothetical protein